MTTKREPESKGASPGPWEWDSERIALLRPSTEEERQARTYREPPVGSMIPVLVLCADHGYPPDDADAQLIALAPEMAAMLRELSPFVALWRSDEFDRCLKCGETGAVNEEELCAGCFEAVRGRLNALLDKVGR